MHVAVECFFFFSNRDNIVDAASIGQRSRWGKSNRNRKTHIGLIKRLWTFPVRWLHADGVIHELRFLFFPTPPPPSVLFPPPSPLKRVGNGETCTGFAIDAKLVRCQIELKAFPLAAANSTTEHRVVGQIYVWKIGRRRSVWENICSYFAHGNWTLEQGKKHVCCGEKGGASDFPSVFSFPIVTRLIPEV